ncbi:MAG: DUF6917 domain-containing protein [Ignavibacteriales bacterium]
MPDPYATGALTENPFARKEPVSGRLVAILRRRADDRELELIKALSRCLVKGQVHELIVTDEEAAPGGRVNMVAYLGFFEVQNSGVIVAGDTVSTGGVRLGELAGFDLTHFPNHMNIVIKAGSRKTGEEMGLEIGSIIQFSTPAQAL